MADTTLAEIKDIIRELDPRLSERDPSFSTAVILLASAFLGPDEDAIARFTGLCRHLIGCYGKRLRESGVWGSDGKIHCEWMDEETGAAAFWLDVCVAEGIAERVRD